MAEHPASPLAPTPEGWAPAEPQHVPAPSYWPAALSLGVTLFFWGLISSLILVGFGLAVFVISLVGWIRELRHERQQQH